MRQSFCLLAAGTATPDSAALALLDSAWASGVLEGADSASRFELDSSACARDGCYEGFSVVIDIDGSFATTGDVERRTIAAYYANRTLALAQPLSATPSSASTYAVYSVTAATFGGVGGWTRDTGELVLEVTGSSTLTSSVSASAEQLAIAATPLAPLDRALPPPRRRDHARRRAGRAELDGGPRGGGHARGRATPRASRFRQCCRRGSQRGSRSR